MSRRVVLSLEDLDSGARAKALSQKFLYVPSNEGTLAAYSGSPKDTSKLVKKAMENGLAQLDLGLPGDPDAIV
ncbi:MAG TPA: hypothetical protein VGI52_06585 [Solirubrobacteraceae bacterium]|jgi:hypothetical protein